MNWAKSKPAGNPERQKQRQPGKRPPENEKRIFERAYHGMKFVDQIAKFKLKKGDPSKKAPPTLPDWENTLPLRRVNQNVLCETFSVTTKKRNRTTSRNLKGESAR